MKTIEQMAVEAGLGMETEAGFTSWPDMVPLKEWTELERFAALVRADEREKLPVIETCDRGHRFGFLPDHPRDSGGLKRCPHCLAIGLDAERARVAELEQAIRDASDWVLAGEGVGLTYYFCPSDGDTRSAAVIDALVEKP